MTLQFNRAKVMAEFAAASEAALQEGAEMLLELSNKRVPVDDADLKKSGEAQAEGTTGTVSYSAPYAIRQHERLDYEHTEGGQAKFLETAAHAHRSDIGEAIAERLREELGR